MYVSAAPTPIAAPSASSPPEAALPSTSVIPAERDDQRHDPPRRRPLAPERDGGEQHGRRVDVEDQRQQRRVHPLQRAEEQPRLGRVADRAHRQPREQRAPRQPAQHAAGGRHRQQDRRGEREAHEQQVADPDVRRRRRACRRSPSRRSTRRTAGRAAGPWRRCCQRIPFISSDGYCTEPCSIATRCSTSGVSACCASSKRAEPIHGAARALDYTPSAISQQLAVLEREAGVALLERSGRNVRLTEAGQVLVRHATSLLDGVEAAEAELADVAAGPRRRASSASPPSSPPSCGSSPPRSPRWPRSHPDVRVEATEREVEEAVPALRLRHLDVVVGDEYEGQPRAVHADLERERAAARAGPARAPRGPSRGRARARRDAAARRRRAGPPASRAPATARCRSAPAASSAASSRTCVTPPTTS